MQSVHHVNLVVRAYSSLLTLILPRFVELGYDLNSDAWQNCSGELFRSLVLGPLLEFDHLNVVFDIRDYASWPEVGSPLRLGFVPERGSALVLRRGRENSWTLDQALSPEWEASANLVEFNHPFRLGTDPEALSYAAGYATLEGQIVHVYAPVSTAEFRIVE
jgi:hypothetical protein